MNIKNVKIYGVEESIIRSGYPMQMGEPGDIYESNGSLLDFLDERNHARAKKLAKTPPGSGHNNFLKGIIVQFDLRYPQYWTPQLQRYHWFEIISSQSKMHSLTNTKDIKNSCNKYVVDNIIKIINDLIIEYNSNKKYPRMIYSTQETYWGDYELFMENVESKEELFHYVISNLPMGFELWMGISTNYLQLKTIYNQRKNHKLEDWREFCSFIESLPMAKELILCEG